MMGLPARLVSWDLDSGQQLQRRSSFLWVSGAQDVCASTLFKTPWPFYLSLSVLSSYHGGSSSGQIRCSSSSIWKKSSSSANASGKSQTIEELWEEYFADTYQWWDNRVDKRTSRSPDFKHKVTRQALWVDGWSTPAWVKTRLNLVDQGKLQCHDRTTESQDTAQPNRLLKGNSEKETLCLLLQES